MLWRLIFLLVFMVEVLYIGFLIGIFVYDFLMKREDIFFVCFYMWFLGMFLVSFYVYDLFILLNVWWEKFFEKKIYCCWFWNLVLIRFNKIFNNYILKGEIDVNIKYL